MLINGFTYGALTPGLAYVMSCIGSALGLQSMSRARAMTGASRVRWLGLAAASIGGTGIWVMHFIAMLGFSVAALPITYDLPLTITSMVVAILVVGAGLGIVVRGGSKASVLLLGGTLTGLGVAGMHYLGMAAVRMDADVHYDMTLVAASIVIAVVAATAALWAALNIRGLPATLGAALIMGLAVSGMHYTGMAALRVAAKTTPMAMAGEGGMSAQSLLTPLVIGISITTVAILLLVALAPTEQELREEAEMEGYAAALRARR
jgi:NO-binding membrane sensor protein with MHYT domain